MPAKYYENVDTATQEFHDSIHLKYAEEVKSGITGDHRIGPVGGMWFFQIWQIRCLLIIAQQLSMVVGAIREKK